MAPELIALSLVVLLFSVIVHEVMHGVVARYFGDHTAEAAGRLTLNPIPHIDPIWTVLIPLILVISGSPIVFGAAKPVPVNPLNFTDIKRGEFFVSIAGIGANVGLAIISAVLWHILGINNPQSLLSGLLVYATAINLILAIFNIIPVPPLDGSKVLMAILPYEMARAYQSLERFGFLLIIILLLVPLGNTNLISFILGNGVNFFLNLLQMPPL